MYEQVNAELVFDNYLRQILETLLRDMAFSAHKTVETPAENNVHDLRVIGLRLRHALRLFGKAFPRKASRKVRKRLAELQDLLADVRGCDVALAVLKEGPIAGAISARQRVRVETLISQRRRRAVRPLALRLKKMQRSGTLQRWRQRLALSA
jgi:inorganic triphosphatase YgiF